MELLNKHVHGTPPDAVYIGRGSPLGNLKVIGKDGTRDEVIDWYKGWLRDKLIERNTQVEAAFKSLKASSRLLCFCSPKRCHGEVIAAYWEKVASYPTYEEGLRALVSMVPEHRKIDDPDPSVPYKEWLATKLINRDPEVERDFRDLELSYKLIPHEYRNIKSDKIILEYYGELVKDGDYDASLLLFAKKYGNKIIYHPKDDGITHINVYSKGATKLGTALTNFAPIGFTHPTQGHFKSIEGYWYWLATGKIHEQLRDLHGHDAKTYGKKLIRVEVKDFKQQVKKAMLLKIEQHPRLLEVFKSSTLPLTHYYYYGSIDNPKIIPSTDPWFEDWLEMIRLYLNGKAHKVIIAGSRGITEYKDVEKAYVTSGLSIIEVVSGAARGVDTLGELLAEKLEIPVSRFIPDWDGLGKRAGMLRNFDMGNYATALIAIWDGKSPGTKGMIDYMVKLKKPHYVSIPPVESTPS